MSQFIDARREYDFEVDVVASRLVREGYHPDEAIRKAHRLVQERRRERARNDNRDTIERMLEAQHGR